MPLYFPLEKEKSPLFGSVFRPYAIVSFWSKKQENWLDIAMIVDSGADYTILPKFYVEELGIQLGRESRSLSTQGVGGSSEVFFLKKKHPIKLGQWELQIPLGFINQNDTPPLLGRQEFMELFRVSFHNHIKEIDDV